MSTAAHNSVATEQGKIENKMKAGKLKKDKKRRKRDAQEMAGATWCCCSTSVSNKDLKAKVSKKDMLKNQGPTSSIDDTTQ